MGGINLGDYFSPSQSIGNFGQLVTVIVRNAFVLAGILSFLLLVFGGFRIVVGAGGDSKRLEQGKQAMVGAVMGLLIVITSFWIVQMLQLVTGVNLLQLSP